MEFLKRINRYLIKTGNPKEITASSPDRILVMGSRLSGSFNLADGLEQRMKEMGIENVNVDVLRDAGKIDLAFFDVNSPKELSDQEKLNLPKGIILLPEMRQEDPFSLSKMTIDTNSSGVEEYVKRLCDECNIPLLILRKIPSVEELSEGVRELLPKNI